MIGGVEQRRGIAGQDERVPRKRKTAIVHLSQVSPLSLRFYCIQRDIQRELHTIVRALAATHQCWYTADLAELSGFGGSSRGTRAPSSSPGNAKSRSHLLPEGLNTYTDTLLDILASVRQNHNGFLKFRMGLLIFHLMFAKL